MVTAVFQRTKQIYREGKTKHIKCRQAFKVIVQFMFIKVAVAMVMAGSMCI